MTCLATHALRDVGAVIEEHERGQGIDPIPLNGLAGRKAVAHRSEVAALEPDLIVTGKTDFRGGDAGIPGALYGGMAVAAINLKGPGVLAVIEPHRLRERPVLASRLGRAHIPHQANWDDDDDNGSGDEDRSTQNN